MTQQQQAGAHSHVTPCDRTFWVRQGDILAGVYPGHPDPVKHRKRVEQIAGAGILTWINLTEEDECNNAGEPFARYDRLARDCAVSKKETACLLRFPVPDLGVPSVEQMTSILDAIDLSLTAGRPVYVHCFGGVGRTGTVVCCWLLRHGVVTEEDVFPRLDVLRRADEKTAGRPAPENSQQCEYVRAWRQHDPWISSEHEFADTRS